MMVSLTIHMLCSYNRNFSKTLMSCFTKANYKKFEIAGNFTRDVTRKADRTGCFVRDSEKFEMVDVSYYN